MYMCRNILYIYVVYVHIMHTYADAYTVYIHPKKTGKNATIELPQLLLYTSMAENGAGSRASGPCHRQQLKAHHVQGQMGLDMHGCSQIQTPNLKVVTCYECRGSNISIPDVTGLLLG